jgi:hypothetical protein
LLAGKLDKSHILADISFHDAPSILGPALGRGHIMKKGSFTANQKPDAVHQISLVLNMPPTMRQATNFGVQGFYREVQFPLIPICKLCS